MVRAGLVALASLYAYDFVACHGRYAEITAQIISAIQRSFV
jgi:hypothetical protein